MASVSTVDGTSTMSAWHVYWRWLGQPLLRVVEPLAGLMLAVDLVIVFSSVLGRHLQFESFDWSDDVARALLVAVTFFGAAASVGRGETLGIDFFMQHLPRSWRPTLTAFAALVTTIVSAAMCWYALTLSISSMTQTTATGLPQNLFYYPMVVAGLVMTIFAAGILTRHRPVDLAKAALVLILLAVSTALADRLADINPLTIMAAAFVLCLVSGVSIAYVLAFSTLVFLQVEGNMPGEIFAQQTASGIDNFVLLAVPFFILTGYAMEANGMSARLIELLQRLLGRVRGGFDVVMIIGMVIFSGISGSKMADVAAVGSIMIPAVRRVGRNPGEAVAVLAASAIMAEAIPPCVNLIILGFVANLSIGGLFVAGLVPAGMMALALIAICVIFPAKQTKEDRPAGSLAKLWGGAALAIGMVVIIFGGYRSGFATATEISAFAVVYALLVGGIAFRELTPRKMLGVCITGAARSGMMLFIVAAAQSVAFVLTIEQIPHELASLMVEISGPYGNWMFLVITIVLLVIMGSMLEGAPALIIFGPLLVPVAEKLGIDPLHYGIVMILSMGIGLFAPPLGVGLYGSCAIGNVKIEDTVRPLLRLLGILFLCLLVIAFVPSITLALPRALGL
ncbi:TRAP transporter large permease subunit [Telmatospirillum sp.]|uniref:TRAP transporter large permease n=1 Tax=Telmatospirillum sp. TaxID=2079197 RepID=UPI00283F637C|nr:TRAP transporter large permease subunit [Telmatospirillum sp.]MDR3437384.1 TRAP transporter large permease subunit [Telmatospirillum sp.]